MGGLAASEGDGAWEECLILNLHTTIYERLVNLKYLVHGVILFFFISFNLLKSEIHDQKFLNLKRYRYLAWYLRLVRGIGMFAIETEICDSLVAQSVRS